MLILIPQQFSGVSSFREDMHIPAFNLQAELDLLLVAVLGQIIGADNQQIPWIDNAVIEAKSEQL